MKSLNNKWIPLFFEKELTDKPLKKILNGIELVFVKLDNKISCFEDRCPHRNVPLSNGKVINKNLQCNYHGWEFNNNGECEKIIGCEGCSKKENISLKKYNVIINNGLVYVNINGENKFENYFNNDEDFDSKIYIKSLKSDYVHTIENFLDATHTSFIHKGLLRSDGEQIMDIEQVLLDDNVVSTYNLKNKQNGIINKLFDSGIDKNIVTFNNSGFAKIEYLKDGKKLFQVSIFFVPISKGVVNMVTQVSIIKDKIPSLLKFILLRPFMELAFYQDKKILESQYIQNKEYNKEYKIVKSDVMINYILYLLGVTKNKPPLNNSIRIKL